MPQINPEKPEIAAKDLKFDSKCSKFSATKKKR